MTNERAEKCAWHEGKSTIEEHIHYLGCPFEPYITGLLSKMEWLEENDYTLPCSCDFRAKRAIGPDVAIICDDCAMGKASPCLAELHKRIAK